VITAESVSDISMILSFPAGIWDVGW